MYVCVYFIGLFYWMSYLILRFPIKTIHIYNTKRKQQQHQHLDKKKKTKKNNIEIKICVLNYMNCSISKRIKCVGQNENGKQVNKNMVIVCSIIFYHV